MSENFKIYYDDLFKSFMAKKNLFIRFKSIKHSKTFWLENSINNKKDFFMYYNLNIFQTEVRQHNIFIFKIIKLFKHEW